MSAPIGYNLIFEDSFDTLDPARWKATLPTEFSGYGQEIWDPTHAAASGGLLTLTATPDMHSGEVRSLQSFGYGYYEARMKLPATPGFWPAFWTVSSAGTFQEIDIAECNSADPHRIGENLHWGVRGASPADNGGYNDPLTDFQADFHTYGVLYAVDRIEFYVDDVKRREFIYHVPPEFFDPMQVRFSLSIFGPNQPYSAPPDASTVWPGVLAVDWVRVYEPGTIDPPPGDTTPPTVSITTPAAGALVTRKSKVTVQASATDDTAVTKVDFLVNGALKKTLTAAAYSYDWTVPAPPNATYKLEAIAWDAAGNNATAAVTVKSR